MALDVDRDVAVPHGTSHKANWRLAKTLGGHWPTPYVATRISHEMQVDYTQGEDVE
ncbi:MAG: hypothetical protein WBF93_03120 [Pirellulales bacterium]